MRAAKLLLSAPLLLCLAWGAPAWAQAPAAGMKIVQIMDMQGFGQPVVAAMAHIPASWQTQGGVNWDRRTPCVGNQLKLEWTTQSPDGQQAVELMHGFSWQVQGTQISMNPCPVMGLRSTREFLQAVAQQRRPGAQIGAYRDRADIAQAAQKAAKVQPGVQLRVDAGELELAYRAGNTLVREVLSSSVTFTQMQGNVVAGTAMVLAQRAPQDRFDPQMATRITASLQTNPHWIEMSTGALSHAERQYSSAQRQAIDRWHATEMARINAQGAADRAAIRAQTQREVGQIQSQTYNNTQATNDRMHRRNMEGVGEYNTYRDSSGNTVRSSIHGGERVLRHGDGSYSSTNNPYYNPAGSQELQRVK